MGRSPAFARIEGEVLEVVLRIPPGRVATYAEIGRYLGVMARHVAYILATLADDEREALPWHRVVGEGGRISPNNPHRAAEQARRLSPECVKVAVSGHLPESHPIAWRPGR